MKILLFFCTLLLGFYLWDDTEESEVIAQQVSVRNSAPTKLKKIAPPANVSAQEKQDPFKVTLEDYKKEFENDERKEAHCSNRIKKGFKRDKKTHNVVEFDLEKIFESLYFDCLFHLDSKDLLLRRLKQGGKLDEKLMDKGFAWKNAYLFSNIFSEAFKRDLKPKDKKRLLWFLKKNIYEFPPQDTYSIASWTQTINNFLSHCEVDAGSIDYSFISNSIRQDYREIWKFQDDYYTDKSYESYREYITTMEESTKRHNIELKRYFEQFQQDLSNCAMR